MQNGFYDEVLLRIPFNEVESPGRHALTYVRRHIPTGREWEVSRTFMSRLHLLVALDRWNRMQPNTWSYRSRN